MRNGQRKLEMMRDPRVSGMGRFVDEKKEVGMSTMGLTILRLGRMGYQQALAVQHRLVEKVKAG